MTRDATHAMTRGQDQMMVSELQVSPVSGIGCSLCSRIDGKGNWKAVVLDWAMGRRALGQALAACSRTHVLAWSFKLKKFRNGPGEQLDLDDGPLVMTYIAQFYSVTLRRKKNIYRLIDDRDALLANLAQLRYANRPASSRTSSSVTKKEKTREQKRWWRRMRIKRKAVE